MKLSSISLLAAVALAALATGIGAQTIDKQSQPLAAGIQSKAQQPVGNLEVNLSSGMISFN